jgi:hypothetical protein
MPNLQPPSSSSEAIPVTGTSGPWNDCEKRDGSVQRGWEETHWATAQTVEENKGRRTGASSLRGGLFDPVLRAQVRQEERNALIHFSQEKSQVQLIARPTQRTHGRGKRGQAIFSANSTICGSETNAWKNRTIFPIQFLRRESSRISKPPRTVPRYSEWFRRRRKQNETEASRP